MSENSILKELLQLARSATGAQHATLHLHSDPVSAQIHDPNEPSIDFGLEAVAGPTTIDADCGLITAAPIVGPTAETGWLAVCHTGEGHDPSSTLDVVSRIARLIEERLDREAEQLRLDELSELLRSNQERLHVTRDELSMSNQELEQFAYIAAHELVAPLRAVAVYAEVLESVTPFADSSSDRAHECVNEIRSGVQHMTRQVQALLELSTSQLNADSAVPVDVAAVVQAALDTLAPTLDAMGAEVTVGKLPVVLATTVPLQSVFANLFSNAIRYRSQDRPLKVHVTSSVLPGVHRVEVSDNGSGVAKVDRARIFQMFERASTTEKGSGIGLALSRKILSTYDASIAVEPGPESGTVFKLEFPLADTIVGL